MIRTHQAGKMVREEALLKETDVAKVGEIADGQIDFSALEVLSELRRRHRQRPDHRVRRQRAKALEEPGQEHHLAHVGQGKAEGSCIELRVECFARAQRVLQVCDHRAHRPHQRMRPRRRRHAARRTNEQRVIERRAHPAQRHAHGRLTHAELLRGAAHAELVVERERNGHQIEIELIHRVHGRVYP